MINHHNTTYSEMHDMSVTTAQLSLQLLLITIGMLSMMVVCYGLVKFFTREK